MEAAHESLQYVRVRPNTRRVKQKKESPTEERVGSIRGPHYKPKLGVYSAILVQRFEDTTLVYRGVLR